MLINGRVYRQQFLPRGVLTSIRFCWVCAAGLSDLLSHYSHFCGQIIDTIHWHMPISLLLGKTECWGHNNLLLLTLDCKGKLILYSNLKFTFHSQKPHYYEH